MPRPAVIPEHQDSNGWWGILPKPMPPRVLEKTVRVETAIIGAGVCGLAVAHQLGKHCPDADIVVLEAERAGFGASGRNAGFMLNVHSHGPPKKLEILRRNMNLWSAGLTDMRRMVAELQIQCDWHEFGRYYGAAGPDGEKHIDEIADTLDQLDLKHHWLNREEMQHQIGTAFYNRGLHTEGSALVNPAALMRGLARHLPTNVSLYEESPVVNFEPRDGGYLIETKSGQVQADRLVLAAGVFLKQFGVADGRFVPMATYASLTAPLSERQLEHLGTGKPFGLLGGSEYGATIRLTNDKRLLVRNYFNHVPGAPSPKKRIMEISGMHQNAMRARWPAIGELPFEHSWGGAMAFTWNNGTVFGETAPGLFSILTNDVSPMTRGMAAGRLLADLMEGHDSELLSLQMSMPEASRLPPRPLLDIGIAIRRGLLHFAARKEF